jgi:hypothetical protein
MKLQLAWLVKRAFEENGRGRIVTAVCTIARYNVRYFVTAPCMIEIKHE